MHSAPFALAAFLAWSLLGLAPAMASVELDYIYDANGNLIQGDGKYYEYNDANRLVRVRHYNATGPVIAEYTYDANGQRVKKVENEITTYYIGKQFDHQAGPGDARDTSYYFVNGQRVAKKATSEPASFYHTNHLGSTDAMTNGAATASDRSRYFSFGETRQAGDERYGFTGKEKDGVSGQHYFEARYLDSDMRHFAQADTVVPDLYVPQSLNRFSYVLNNPEKYTDPSGNFYAGGKEPEFPGTYLMPAPPREPTRTLTLTQASKDLLTAMAWPWRASELYEQRVGFAPSLDPGTFVVPKTARSNPVKGANSVGTYTPGKLQEQMGLSLSNALNQTPFFNPIAGFHDVIQNTYSDVPRKNWHLSDRSIVNGPGMIPAALFTMIALLDERGEILIKSIKQFRQSHNPIIGKRIWIRPDDNTIKGR